MSDTTPTPLLDGIIQEASIHGNSCYPKITEMARELRLLKAELAASRELCRQFKEVAEKCLDCLIPVFRGEHEILEAKLEALNQSVKDAEI